jgi:1-phosphofructokinase family hexose kinase
MLLVVCPNLAIDRILQVDQFRASAVQRSRTSFSQPGGKGSNVARVFRQLGGDVVLTGFVGRRNAALIVDPLREKGIQVDAVEGFSGDSRTCTIVCDPASSSHPTVINEESPEIEAGAADALLSTIDRWLGDAGAVLVTGSLPVGLSADFYRRVLERVVSRGVFAAIDATGPVLRHGLDASPHLLKANLEETTSAIGHLGTEPREIADSLKRHGGRLPSHTLLTLGESGAILINAGHAWYAQPPRVSYANPIGAGDAFAAGYLKAHLDGSPPDFALRFATAVASSDAATLEPGLTVIDEIQSLLSITSTMEL